MSTENDNKMGIEEENCTAPPAKPMTRDERKQSLKLALSKSHDCGSDKSSDESESEEDLLAILDHTPDALDVNSCFSGPRYIAHGELYNLQKFAELMPQVFIRKQGISLTIVSIDHQPGPLSFLDQHAITFEIHHGNCNWTITRKTKQITSLHHQLRYFKAKLRLPATSSEARERRQSMRTQIKGTNSKDDTKSKRRPSERRMVKYPRRQIHRMDGHSKTAVETYMSNLLQHSLLKAHESVLEFFEISSVSFVLSLGQKLKEGYVKKRTQRGNSLRFSCLGRFRRRWLVLRETCLFFLTPQNGQIRNVMLMDGGFQVSHGFRHTGVPKGIKITNLSKTLLIRCDGEESERSWARAIENAKNHHGYDFIRENRFSSFAPVRKNSQARWYVDGACFMSDIADMLEEAQEEIFITDWWLSPDIYMKRPDLTGIQWRLSEVLRRQAERGVRIFILLYKEVKLALGLDSLYTKHCLGRLHSNIKVLRHPDHLKGGSLYWAHHEKMVVIDQKFAFVGGIDLCYGRWDDYRHKLVDVGHGGFKKKRPSSPSLGLGLATLVQSTHSLFNSDGLPKTSPLASRSEKRRSWPYHSSETSKETSPRTLSEIPSLVVTDMEEAPNTEGSKEDISDPHNATGSSLWSSQKMLVKPEESVATSSDEDSDSDKTKRRKSRSTSRTNWNLRTMRSLGMGIVQEVKKTRAKSLVDKAMVKLHRSSSTDSEDGLSTKSDDEQIRKAGNKRKMLQQKWKRGLRKYGYVKRTTGGLQAKINSLADLHKGVNNEESSSVHLWVGKDYVNWITKDLYDAQSPFKDNVNRHLTPRMPWHDIALYVEGEAARDAARHFIQRWNAVKTEKVKFKEHYPYLVPKTYDPTFLGESPLNPKHNVKCQVLRSIGPWSAGIAGKERERSIYLAYIDAIKKSQHFIYIENQFFITACSDIRTEVFNTVGFHLAERIIKAHRNGDKFRVYIVLPLLPAFEGLIGTPNGTPMQYIIYYTLTSIIRGPNSLIGRLNQANVCWQNYLTFCSLRNHDVLEGELITELVYVHSKLMIVDDRIVIAGSANINDRSLLGDRDSEVDLIIEDTEFTKGVMNGRPYDRGDFAGSLRMFLFNEHLGLGPNPHIDVQDPLSDEFFRLWQGIASKNTKIYDEVFNAIPCDAASTFVELRALQARIPLSRRVPDLAKEMVSKIQGHLVLFPLMFLQNESLKPGPNNKEFLLPFDLWT